MVGKIQSLKTETLLISKKINKPVHPSLIMLGQQINEVEFHKHLEIYTERKKKRRVNFIPKFHSSLKKFVKYFTMITKWYMYGTKVPNFIGL